MEELRENLRRLVDYFKNKELLLTALVTTFEEYSDQQTKAAYERGVREACEGIKAGVITTSGEYHEDFGPTWRTKMIDSAQQSLIGKRKHE